MATPVLPPAHLPCPHTSYQSSPAKTKHPGDHHKSNQQNRVGRHICWWTNSSWRNLGQELPSKAEQVKGLRAEEATTGKPPRTLILRILLLKIHLLQATQPLYMSLKVHCKTTELTVVKRTVTFIHLWFWLIFHYHFRSGHMLEFWVSRNGWTKKERNTQSVSYGISL